MDLLKHTVQYYFGLFDAEMDYQNFGLFDA